MGHIEDVKNCIEYFERHIHCDGTKNQGGGGVIVKLAVGQQIVNVNDKIWRRSAEEEEDDGGMMIED